MRRDPRNDEIREGLRALRPELDRWVAPAPPAALVERTLLRAREELRERDLSAATPPPELGVVPVGFKRELVRLMVATIPALLLIFGWNALVLTSVPAVLETWLPSGVAFALAAAYVVGALGWTALVYGSLPLVAHRRAAHRLQENAA